MATLLSVRDDFPEPEMRNTANTEATRELASPLDEGMAFRQAEAAPPLLTFSKPVQGTRYLSLTLEHQETAATSVVHGVSLYGVLQMLHLERKTCIIEVVSEHRFGTMTLVNGELVDADVDGIEGEPAVYQILAWDQPKTTIMDGVSLFRHTVNLPIAQLLVESVRLQDEAAFDSSTGIPLSIHGVNAMERTHATAETGNRLSDWKWLVETLIIGGARTAAIIRAQDESVLSVGNEYGGLAKIPTEQDVAELVSICRSARRWSRMVDPAVTEVVLRVEDYHVLIAPLDKTGQIFAYVMINANDSLEFIRGAIRSVIR